MKRAYRKLALRYHPDKNKHTQDSDVMCMINEAKKDWKTYCVIMMK